MEQRLKEAALEEENNRRREIERRAADRAREKELAEKVRVEEKKAGKEVPKKAERLEEEKGQSKPEAAEKQGNVNELGFDDAAISSIEEVTGGKRTLEIRPPTVQNLNAL